MVVYNHQENGDLIEELRKELIGAGYHVPILGRGKLQFMASCRRLGFNVKTIQELCMVCKYVLCVMGRDVDIELLHTQPVVGKSLAATSTTDWFEVSSITKGCLSHIDITSKGKTLIETEALFLSLFENMFCYLEKERRVWTTCLQPYFNIKVLKT